MVLRLVPKEEEDVAQEIIMLLFCNLHNQLHKFLNW